MYIYRRSPDVPYNYDPNVIYLEESLDYAEGGDPIDWLRLHYLPNAYGYGVMWVPVDFTGTPAVRIPLTSDPNPFIAEVAKDA